MKKILVVDDEEILREVYAFVLEASGYEVTMAHDGDSAVALLKELQPDLILLDLLMPGTDGIGFLRQTDIKHKHPEIIVVAFSNLSDSGQVEAALKLGARKHITKSSLTPREVVDLVTDLLAEPIHPS